jgi:hypothetical protein
MLIYDFIYQWGAKNPSFPSFYENSNRVSYETIGKGNNRDHSFTYLFEKLFESINDKLWTEYKKSIRKSIKNNDNQKKINIIKNIIKSLNEKDPLYKSKNKFLKKMQYPIILRIKNSKRTRKQITQQKQNSINFKNNPNPTLSNVLKSTKKK